jgi:hypothetical protein
VWFAVFGMRDRFHNTAEIERMLRSAGLTPGGFETVFTVFRVPAVSSVWAKGQRHECAKPATARESS